LRRLGEKSDHVDNHDMWINPNNTDHYLVGCDGGVYESHDRGVNWDFKDATAGTLGQLQKSMRDISI